jgi:hypothetical protein
MQRIQALEKVISARPRGPTCKQHVLFWQILRLNAYLSLVLPLLQTLPRSCPTKFFYACQQLSSIDCCATLPKASYPTSPALSTCSIWRPLLQYGLKDLIVVSLRLPLAFPSRQSYHLHWSPLGSLVLSQQVLQVLQALAWSDQPWCALPLESLRLTSSSTTRLSISRPQPSLIIRRGLVEQDLGYYLPRATILSIAPGLTVITQSRALLCISRLQSFLFFVVCSGRSLVSHIPHTIGGARGILIIINKYSAINTTELGISQKLPPASCISHEASFSSIDAL